MSSSGSVFIRVHPCPSVVKIILSGFDPRRVFTGKKMTDSQHYLAEYARNGSETAFRELVRRYVDLVYSAALRLVDGNTQLAEDVTQTVFIDLARKAGNLSTEVMLGGWLHRHACFVASKTLRGERRRQLRERQAAEMNALHDDPGEFKQIAPLLDDTINSLSAEDRAAILLRFFEQRDFRSIGRSIGSTEEGARKRVTRALEKLHGLLTRRGVTLSATALATVLAAKAVVAAPAALAATISTAAVTAAATTGTLTLAHLMTTTAFKTVILSTIAIAAVATPLIFQHQTTARLRAENTELKQKAEQLAALTAENQRLASQLAEANNPQAAGQGATSELLRLRGEVASLRTQAKEVEALRAQNTQLRARAASAPSASATTDSSTRAMNACINNLRQIDGAKQQWALENNMSPTNTPTVEDVTPYLGRGPKGEFPQCPSGGTYTLGSLTEAPTCSVPGHALP
jgi:RNA polymerase sigma factor (sigma-70 family)